MLLIAILNKATPLKNLMNALAHMTFGIGHRLNGIPAITVLFADEAVVRAFRNESLKYANTLQDDQVVFTDFPHTMVGASNADLLKTVVETPAEDVTYFGACLLTRELPKQLHTLLEQCSQLAGYDSKKSISAAQLLQARSEVDLALADMKISLVLDKAELTTVINNVVEAALLLGQHVPYNQQRLLNIKGNPPDTYDGLRNISFHSLVVTKASKGFAAMSELARSTVELKTASVGPVVMTFGQRDHVEAVFPKEKTRLFADELKAAALVPIESKILATLGASAVSGATSSGLVGSAATEASSSSFCASAAAMRVGGLSLHDKPIGRAMQQVAALDVSKEGPEERDPLDRRAIPK